MSSVRHLTAPLRSENQSFVNNLELLILKNMSKLHQVKSLFLGAFAFTVAIFKCLIDVYKSSTLKKCEKAVT